MRRWIRLAVLVLAAAGVVVGADLVAAPHGPATFGWTAYAPLSSTVFAPSPVVPLAAAVALLVVSAFVLGAAAAVLWTGRRRRASSS